MVLLVATLASLPVAVLAPLFAPDVEGDVVAEPLLDPAAFYREDPVADAARNMAVAHIPGTPLLPTPVAGLNQVQTNYAYIIVEVARRMDLPERAMVVAIITALQETRLRNLANPKVPASLRLPHDGTGTNFDSVGLFQQRPSMGWGTVPQLMDPAQSAARFYAKLVKVRNWQQLSVGGAAQAVQRSAFGGAYAKHTLQAEKIVDKLG